MGLHRKKRQKLDSNEDGEDELQMDMSSSSSSLSFSPSDAADDTDPLQTKGSSSDPKGSDSKPSMDPALLEHARSRLSKFGARLLDPNRIKGLVEPPQIIPINDEFLTAFGKREKEFDKATGREGEFQQEIQSDDEDDNEGDSIGGGTKRGLKNLSVTTDMAASKEGTSAHGSTKIKISNLSYRTSEETLSNVCLMFGTLKEVKMVLDRDPPAGSDIHNSGRAYVTFDMESAAMACMDGLKTLEGRDLRITQASTKAKTPKASSSAATPANASLLNKMFERDISTVCFQCGKVGHIGANCPNPPKPKPCNLCGMTDHEQRMCPYNRTCFNCGAPGHLNRDCTMRRGLPRRMVCGICLQSGHHRLQCHQRNPYQVPPSVLADAVCMVCGQKGHFMCKDLKWFYSLSGYSCFNCGAQGHSGYDCQRPTLHHCIQNQDEARREIDRAEANSIAEDLERQHQGRGRTAQRGDNGRNGSSGSQSRGSKKVQSMPPAIRSREQQGFGGRNDRRGYS